MTTMQSGWFIQESREASETGRKNRLADRPMPPRIRRRAVRSCSSRSRLLLKPHPVQFWFCRMRENRSKVRWLSISAKSMSNILSM